MTHTRIALVADPHLCLNDLRHNNLNLSQTHQIVDAVMADLERTRPDLTIWMGDLTHEGTQAVRRRFGQLAAGLSVPCLWMLGNHDVEVIDKDAFSRQAVPCVRQHWQQISGWNLVILDTVRERSPEDTTGLIPEAGAALLRQVAREPEPLLVLGHHPAREKYFNSGFAWFRDCLAEHTDARVYLGAHSHRDLHETDQGWDLIDISSCCRAPLGYHWMELSPQSLSLTRVGLTLPGIEGGPDPNDEPIHPLTITTRSASSSDVR